MNAKEHAEKLAAARAELARLEAIVPEKERPGMVLPDQSEPHLYGWCLHKDVIKMESQEQCHEYTHAFETMMLMRAQKGIEINDGSRLFAVYVNVAGGVFVMRDSVLASNCMFPCFDTEADARAAIAAVGEDSIIRCAKWLAGCV